MNDKQFDLALRAAMPAGESHGLDSTVDTRIAALERRRGTVRKLSLGTGMLALAIGAVIIFPRPAEAILQRMAGKLDDVDRFTMTRYAVQADGSKTAYSVMSYDHGKWKTQESGGYADLFKAGKSYRFDPALKVYRVSDRPEGPFHYTPSGMALSKFLYDGSMGPDAKVTTEKGAQLNGRDVIKAIQTNGTEKIVFYADPKTELPIQAEISAQSTGWKTAEILTFDYAPKFTASEFEIDPKVKVVTEKEGDTMVTSTLTSPKPLAERDLRKGKFVLRAVDVAADGTVFVSYQAGDKSGSYRGHRLEVTDDLGTRYEEPTEAFRRAPGSPEGRVDQEVFIPLDPDLKWRPRKIKISGNFNAEGDLVFYSRGFEKQPDGGSRLVKVIEDSEPELLWTGSFTQPSCAWHPTSMAFFDMRAFASDLGSQIYRADHLADKAVLSADFGRAQMWLQRAIALKEEANRAGLGPYYSQEQQRELERLRSGVKLTQPPVSRGPVGGR